MAIRSITFVSIALLLGIAAFVLHLLALCSPHWKITKRDREPIMMPVSYGIWERCEYTNVSVIKQGVALGTRANVQYCYPNLYMRYLPESYQVCHHLRRSCSVVGKEKIPEVCSCRYLSSAKALQWLTVLAAIFLGLSLILLYLRTITAPENNSAALALGYGPFICFLLALLLIITGLIVFGAYIRRDTYEDHSFPLPTVANENFNLHSLHNYANSDGGKLSREKYLEADRELRDNANTHYHTVIGRATIYEIIATVLILIATGLSFWVNTLTRSENKV